MKLILFSCLFLFIANAAFGIEKVCENDKHWKEDCNDCWCTKDGTAKACTRMACLKEEDLTRTTPVKQCEPGSRWKIKCNDCWCNAAGTAEACTRIGCSPDVKECEPNSSYMSKCNRCRCNADGTAAACTLMGCPDLHLETLQNN